MMYENIPVSNLPSYTKIRWWSGEAPSRRINERRVDVLIPDLTRLYQAPSAIKPLHCNDHYGHYPFGWGGFTSMGGF